MWGAVCVHTFTLKKKGENSPKITPLKWKVNSNSIWNSREVLSPSVPVTLFFRSRSTCHFFEITDLGHSRKKNFFSEGFLSTSWLIDWKIIWMLSSGSRSPLHSAVRLMHLNNTNKHGPAITLEGVLRWEHHYRLCVVCWIKAASLGFDKKSLTPTRVGVCCCTRMGIAQWHTKIFWSNENLKKEKQRIRTEKWWLPAVWSHAISKANRTE